MFCTALIVKRIPNASDWKMSFRRLEMSFQSEKCKVINIILGPSSTAMKTFVMSKTLCKKMPNQTLLKYAHNNVITMVQIYLDLPNNAVRTCYKKLLKKEDYNGFDLIVGFNDPENKSTRESLIKAVIDKNGGKESCMFSRTYIQAAVKQYYNSQRDKKHKAETGKQEQHKVKCRRQGRIRENRKRMKVGLRRKPWSEEKNKN